MYDKQIPAQDRSSHSPSPIRRIRAWFAILIVVVAIFAIRAFYVQVIDYGHYKTAALSDQLKQYEIPAARGIISAKQGDTTVPLVLNQKLYTIYADPTFIKDPNKVANGLASVLGGSTNDYINEITTKNTRYVVLAKKVSKIQRDKLLAYKYLGIGAQAQSYRIYPDGSLASQLLGFVNNDGQGVYGIEQALNDELSGTAGRVKAVTDVRGVPLAASGTNVETEPVNGDDVTLTVDVGIQAQVEKILKSEYKKTKSQGLSAVVMDVNNGHIKAMANYPTFNPSEYQNVSNADVFQNAAATNAIEPGSTMKVLTTSAALNMGVIQPNSSFYDPAHWVINGFNITDIEEDGGAREQNIQSILALSLNTGAVWELMQMSDPGGTTINKHGIDAWHKYMVDNFRLGEPTGVEQGYESAGFVPPDSDVPAIQLKFANTAFGQGVQVTALQMASALSSVLDGGTYYQPTLIASTTSSETGKTTIHQPKVLEKNVVKPIVGKQMIPLMEGVVKQYYHEGFNFMDFSSNYLVGGKTGTAQVAKPTGGYYKDIFNGTYLGFVGGDQPQYIICVFNIKPNVPGYAGSLGGQPVFADIAHMLIDNGYVTPKT